MSSDCRHSGDRVRLGDVAEVEKYSMGDVGDEDSVWLLNLDAVEKNTGRVISKSYVSPSELGSSTLAFTDRAVLYSKLRPNLNKVVLPDTRGYATTEMLPLLPDDKKLMRRYLAYLLRSDTFVTYAVKSTAGAKMPRVNRKDVLNFQFSLPDMATQSERVKEFSAIEKQTDLYRAFCVKLDELVKSRFIEMFGDPVTNPMGWDVSTIKGTAVTYGDGPFGSNLKSSHYVPKGVRVIRLGNIGVGTFIDEDKSFITEEHFEKLKRYECEPGNVVIATLGTPNLRACLVPDFGVPSIHKADCMYYAPDKSRVLPVFAMSAINNPTMLERATVDVHGQTRARINSTQTGDLPMILPPLELQRQFADFVAKVDKLEFEARQAIDKLQLLYDSLAQEYFGD